MFEFEIDDPVTYYPRHTYHDSNHPDVEIGYVTKVMEHDVFVQYVRNGKLQETSQKTPILLLTKGHHKKLELEEINILNEHDDIFKDVYDDQTDALLNYQVLTNTSEAFVAVFKGNDQASKILINHSLDTYDLFVRLYDMKYLERVSATVQRLTPSTIVIKFSHKISPEQNIRITIS